MTPLRTKMIHDMELQRLAPKTHVASVTAVASLAKFSQCAPDRLSPEHMRTYLHPLLVERRLQELRAAARDQHQPEQRGNGEHAAGHVIDAFGKLVVGTPFEGHGRALLDRFARPPSRAGAGSQARKPARGAGPEPAMPPCSTAPLTGKCA